MKILQRDVILFKCLYPSTGFSAWRLLSEFPDNGWKLESINNLLKRIHQSGTLSSYQAAVDCIRCLAVEDFVLSQEDSQKRHQSAREISHETAILCLSVHRIIHHDLQLKCFKRRCA